MNLKKKHLCFCDLHHLDWMLIVGFPLHSYSYMMSVKGDKFKIKIYWVVLAVSCFRNHQLLSTWHTDTAFYTSNHQKFDCIDIGINLHVRPHMPMSVRICPCPSAYAHIRPHMPISVRICTLVIYPSGFCFLILFWSDSDYRFRSD